MRPNVGASADILVVHAMNQEAALQRNWHFRVDQDAVFLAWGFGFLITVPSGMSLTMAISTIRSTPTLVPVVSRSKNTNGRFKCSFFTNSIMSF